MSTISKIHLQRLHGRLGSLVYQMSKVQFSQFTPRAAWSPALNVYRCDDCMVVCAELAGVDKAEIHLEVESRRLLLRGQREAPEPKKRQCKPNEVLVMEIDYGAFQREVLFPVDVDVAHVTAEQENGLLWIYFPLQTHG
jgi:HSP20 family protein